MLAVSLHQANLTTSSGGFLNLKGIMVGNPMTSWEHDARPAYIEMAYFHGLIPKHLKDSIDQNNCTYRSFNQPPLSEICEENLEKFSKFDENINPLDIYRKFGDGFASPAHFDIPSLYEKSDLDALLGTTYAEYLNREDVMEVLNIPKSKEYFLPCSDVNYTQNEKASFWTYPLIKEYGYKILVYSGDTDGVVPTLGTWKWISDLGWDIKEHQKQWVVDDKVEGFYHQFDGLDFLIFHGAGHLVPIWKKKESHIAVFSWINQRKFP